MCTGDQIKKNEMYEACGMYGGDTRRTHGVLMGRSEGKRPLG